MKQQILKYFRKKNKKSSKIIDLIYPYFIIRLGISLIRYKPKRHKNKRETRKAKINISDSREAKT